MNLNLTEKQKLEWKQQLKDACIAVLEERIAAAERAMRDAQESANSEEKSSAGDKFETSRAMAHLNRDMNARQLQGALREMTVLKALDTGTICPKAVNGAVVVCKEQVFFIALGLGSTIIKGQKVLLLSPQAPIALLLHHKQRGDSFTFSDKVTEILEVF